MENRIADKMQALIKINGLTDIDGMRFHDIEGGFGESKKAMLVKEIAIIHGREVRTINQAINMNRKRFVDYVDIVDLKETEFAINLIDNGIYTQNSINASNNIYLLSERGYSKLLKILEDDVAWEQYEKLVDGYFNMRKEQKAMSMEDIMIAQLQNMKMLKEEVEVVKKENAETKEEIKGIREAVTLDPNQWRKDTATLINKIANKLGGFEHIRPVREEAYKLLDNTYGVKLKTRVLNKQRNMALEGCSKSKITKVNNLDVIAEDKKLINGYISIVGKLAVKYGIREWK